MLIFICAGCGRFGSTEAKTEDGEIVASCPYCGNSDFDWISRPDLDDPKMNVDKLDGLLGSVEKLVMSVMNRAYDAFDLSGDSSATKTAALEEFEKTLYDLFNRFTK